VGRVVSPEDAKVATGLAGSGAERLQGEGDFVLVARGQVTRMQAAFVGAGEVKDLVAALDASRGLGLPAGSGTDGVGKGRLGLAGRLRRVKRR
jgi:DNA segregation ATPase FtsK/SpoIIIE-like protein